MTHLDFINQYNNKKIERVDSSNLNQCFDLAIAYCEDVLGQPRNIFAGNLHAYQIFENPTDTASKNFDFIKNTAYAVPKKGDVIVFGKGYGVSGHVAIVESATVNNFTAFSQNDPIGSPCIMKTYNYNTILGWLRKITNSVSGSELEACLTAHREAVTSATEWEKKYKEELKATEDYKKTIQTLLADKAQVRQKTLLEVEQLLNKLKQT